MPVAFTISRRLIHIIEYPQLKIECTRSMVEYSGIRIDKINLLLTIIIWNECGILPIQLQEDL